MQGRSNDSGNILVEGDGNMHLSSGKADKIQFSFDRVIPQSSTQSDIFELVRPMVHDAFVGYNATIFSYGQTGSGKVR
jgi:kinesin family member 15